MNNNIKSVIITNKEKSKTFDEKNFDVNYLFKLLDLDDSDSYCELEFVNYGKKEIQMIISEISNYIKTLTKNISDKSDNIVINDASEDIEEDYSDKSLFYDNVDINDGIKELFRYKYISDYEENIVICLQPIFNKIVIAIINLRNISEYSHNYALYSSGNEYGNSVIVYGYIGRFIEFYAENFIDCDPSITIFCSNSKKQIATNIKTLDFIKQSSLYMYKIDDISFWKLYFLLGHEYFSDNYNNEDDFNLCEIIPNKSNAEDMYLFYENITFKITSDTKIIEHLNDLVHNDGKLNIKEWRENLKSYLPNSILNYVSAKLDTLEVKGMPAIAMTDEIKIEPLTEEEMIAIAKRVEDNKEFDTELARAIFTIFVSGYEYKVLYKNLQACFSASSEALNKLIGDCIEILDIKDKKKIQMMYNQADAIANKLPEIAQSKLNEMDEVEDI